MSGMKYITHKTVVFTQIKTVVFEGNNTCCVLAPMLKNSQRIIKQLVHVRSADDTDDATHGIEILRVLKLNESHARQFA
jgi:hypothetical protein